MKKYRAIVKDLKLETTVIYPFPNGELRLGDILSFYNSLDGIYYEYSVLSMDQEILQVERLGVDEIWFGNVLRTYMERNKNSLNRKYFAKILNE